MFFQLQPSAAKNVNKKSWAEKLLEEKRELLSSDDDDDDEGKEMRIGKILAGVNQTI